MATSMSRSRKPTLLIVDDVKECADGLGQQLEATFGHDYTLELAESAAEAYEVLDDLEATGSPLALVLSDLIMPHQDGARLLVELHRRQPRALKLLYSGCPRPDDLLYLLAHGRVDGFFVKPWTEEAVVGLIDSCLRQVAWPLAPNLSLLEGSLPPQHATGSEAEALRVLGASLASTHTEAQLIWLESPQGLVMSKRSRFAARLRHEGPDYYRAAAAEGVTAEQGLDYLNAADAPWRVLTPIEHESRIVGWMLAENPSSQQALVAAQRRDLETIASNLGVLAVKTRLLSIGHAAEA
jgi:CheY-like chemotaxis protein